MIYTHVVNGLDSEGYHCKDCGMCLDKFESTCSKKSHELYHGELFKHTGKMTCYWCSFKRNKTQKETEEYAKQHNTL